MNTYTDGIYTATVTDDNYVEVTRNGVLFNRPGPWADRESAIAWAELVPAYYTREDEKAAQA
jgi:hypothetical protein